MRIVDLYNYKYAYMIYKILLNENHPNIIIYGKDISKDFILTILEELFCIKKKVIYNEEIYYEYNDIFYYFDIRKIKLDIKNTFINTIQKITKTYNYYTNKNNYIIIDNFNKINPIIENKLKVLIEKSYTTKFIILTSSFDKILEAIKSRCLCLRLPINNIIDRELYVKKYIRDNDINIDQKKIKIFIEGNNNIDTIIKIVNGFKDPIQELFLKIIKLLNKKLNKNLKDLKELSYNIKISVIEVTELLKKIVNYYISSNLSFEKKKKIIKFIKVINYLKKNNYKNII